MNLRYSESDFHHNSLYCQSSPQAQRSVPVRVSYPKHKSLKQTQSQCYQPNHLKQTSRVNNSCSSSPLYANHSNTNPSNMDYLNSRLNTDKGFSSQRVSNNEKSYKSKHLDPIWSRLPVQVWHALMTGSSSNVALCGQDTSSDTSSAEVSSFRTSSDASCDSTSTEDDGFKLGLFTNQNHSLVLIYLYYLLLYASF
jgi:hypothetical protein